FPTHRTHSSPAGSRCPRHLCSFPTRRSSDLPFGPADSAVALTLDVLLDSARAARMNASHARQPEQPPFSELVDGLLAVSWQASRSEEHTSELQSRENLVCRLPHAEKRKNPSA